MKLPVKIYRIITVCETSVRKVGVISRSLFLTQLRFPRASELFETSRVFWSGLVQVSCSSCQQTFHSVRYIIFTQETLRPLTRTSTCVSFGSKINVVSCPENDSGNEYINFQVPHILYNRVSTFISRLSIIMS